MNTDIERLQRVLSRIDMFFVLENQEQLSAGWRNHWRVTLDTDATFTTPYSCSDRDGAPDIKDVLFCVISDVAMVHPDYCNGFDDFCSNLGYDNDSIKALKIYEQCVATIEPVKALLGDDFDFALENYQLLEDL